MSSMSNEEFTQLYDNITTDNTPKEKPLSEIRIYVADLAAYNNGILRGEWIDATQDADIIEEEIEDMLSGSPIEGAFEWAIHDHEGFGKMSIHEYESISKIAAIAQAIEEYGEVITYYADYMGDFDSVEELKESFEEAYQGIWKSEEDFASELADELIPSDAPSFLTRYFDYEAFTRDLFIGDYFSVYTGDGLAVFRSI